MSENNPFQSSAEIVDPLGVTPQKPTSVKVFGVLNIVFGLLGICGNVFSLVMMFGNVLPQDPNFQNPALELMNTNSAYRMFMICLLYTSPSPRDATLSRMPSSA